MLDRSRIEFKLGSYGVAPGVALENPTWLSRVQGYRRSLGGRMIAFDHETAKKKISSSGEFHISKKIDGEFNMLIFQGDEALLANPGGTVRVGLPLLEEATTLLKAAGVKSAMIPGELHVYHEDGKRERVHDVSRFARKPENQEQVDRLCFAPFDLLELDGEDWTKTYTDTWQWLETTFSDSKLTTPVETKLGEGNKAIDKLFKQWVEEDGGEGVVARSDDRGWYKVKPRHSLDVCVIGFAEGTDDRAGMLHDLLLGIYRNDGSIQVLGRVGGGFSDDQRRDFLNDLRDLVVDSDYAEINSDRVAYEMVKPEWVIEITCLDLISNTTRGASIDRMVLEWEPDPDDENKGCWRTARRLPLCSIISPQFQRIRDDKTAGPQDCRFSQLTDIVEIEFADATSEDLQLPKSEILKRQVRVKELKGRKMVRKLVMWKTNKEEVTRGEFPAYVVHLTDFSPNRKDPLKREIRVSDSKDQIESLYAAMYSSALDVKGWNPADDSDAEPPKKTEKKTTTKKKVSSTKKKAASAKEEEPSSTKKKSTTSAKKKTTSAKKKTPKKKTTASTKKKPASAKSKAASKKKPSSTKKSTKKKIVRKKKTTDK